MSDLGSPFAFASKRSKRTTTNDDDTPGPSSSALKRHKIDGPTTTIPEKETAKTDVQLTTPLDAVTGTPQTVPPLFPTPPTDQTGPTAATEATEPRNATSASSTMPGTARKSPLPPDAAVDELFELLTKAESKYSYPSKEDICDDSKPPEWLREKLVEADEVIELLMTALRKSRTIISHYKLQNTLLIIESQERTKRKEVEDHIVQREVDFLRRNRENVIVQGNAELNHLKNLYDELKGKLKREKDIISQKKNQIDDLKMELKQL